MSIIAVEVICPSTSRSYDYKLPSKMRAGDVKANLAADIRLYENLPELFRDGSSVNVYGESFGLIPDEMSLEEAGVKSGGKIMII